MAQYDVEWLKPDHTSTISFDGTSYADTNYQHTADSGTIEFWLYPRDSSFTFGAHNDAIGGSDRLYIRHDFALGVGSDFTSDPFSPPLNQWSHVVVKFSGGVASLYIDERAGAGYEEVSTLTYTWTDSTGNLYLGAYHRSGATGNTNCSMWNLRVWDIDRPLSEVEAERSAILSGVETGLTAYYPLDDGAGTTAENKVGTDADLLNGAGWEAIVAAYPPSTLVFGIEDTYYDLTDLDSDTSYDWRVRVDDDGTKGDWSAWQTFSTLGIVYDVEYRPVGGTTSLVTSISNTFYDLTALNPNTDYEWRVRADDGVNKGSWSGWVQFTTLTDTTDVIINLLQGLSFGVGKSLSATTGGTSSLIAGQGFGIGQGLLVVASSDVGVPGVPLWARGRLTHA